MTKNYGRLQFNANKIIRDHCNDTGFFRVDVPEANQTGFGFLLRIGPAVYVISLIKISYDTL